MIYQWDHAPKYCVVTCRPVCVWPCQKCVLVDNLFRDSWLKASPVVHGWYHLPNHTDDADTNADFGLADGWKTLDRIANPNGYTSALNRHDSYTRQPSSLSSCILDAQEPFQSFVVTLCCPIAPPFNADVHLDTQAQRHCLMQIPAVAGPAAGLTVLPGSSTLFTGRRSRPRRARGAARSPCRAGAPAGSAPPGCAPPAAPRAPV